MSPPVAQVSAGDTAETARQYRAALSRAALSLGFSKDVARECDPLLRQLGDHIYSRASVASFPTPSDPGYTLLGFRVSFKGTMYYRPRTRALSLELWSQEAAKGYLGSPKRTFYSINFTRGAQEAQEAPERLPGSRKYRNALGNGRQWPPRVLG